MLWSLSKKKEKPMLFFHIGSSAVSGALFEADGSKAPAILFSAWEPIPISENFDPGKFLDKTMQALESVAEKIHNARLGAPQKIYCVLASPWYTSQTRHISLKKNTPFVFTEKLADELIQKEVKLFSDNEQTKSQGGLEATRTIELKNIRTLLNGYETHEPLFKKCHELEMAIFVSMAGESILKEIEKTIFKHFHFERIKFSSFAVGSFTVVRDMESAGNNFLLVDIGGEMTDIFMVKKNVLSEGLSFPMGHNYIIRELAKNLRASMAEAESALSLQKAGHAAASVENRLMPLLKKLSGEWLQKFQESLAHISGDISVPSKVYVTAESDYADMFGDLIKSEQFSQYTLAESKFVVIPLDIKELHPLATFEDLAVREPQLIIDSVYINRFLATM